MRGVVKLEFTTTHWILFVICAVVLSTLAMWLISVQGWEISVPDPTREPVGGDAYCLVYILPDSYLHRDHHTQITVDGETIMRRGNFLVIDHWGGCLDHPFLFDSLQHSSP